MAELITNQNDDGGWSWVNRRRASLAGRQRPPDLGARGLCVVHRPEALGLLTDPRASIGRPNRTDPEFARAASDFETRAAVLHALAALARPASSRPTASTGSARTSPTSPSLIWP